MVKKYVMRALGREWLSTFFRRAEEELLALVPGCSCLKVEVPLLDRLQGELLRFLERGCPGSRAKSRIDLNHIDRSKYLCNQFLFFFYSCPLITSFSELLNEGRLFGLKKGN